MRLPTLCVLPLLLPVAPALHAAALANAGTPVAIREVLVIPGTGRASRTPFPPDLIQARLAAGTWTHPHDGDAFTLPDGESRTWSSLVATNDDWFEPRLRGGYAFAAVVSDHAQVRLLDAPGVGMAWVNGEPRVGDIYANNSLPLPIQLRAGTNSLLFAAGRGRWKATLLPAPNQPFLSDRDPTLPDILAGERLNAPGAVLVINPTATPATHLILRARADRGRLTETPCPVIPPLSFRKIPIAIRHSGDSATNRASLQVELFDDGQRGRPRLSEAHFSLRIRSAGDTFKLTYLSGIDGSVQYCAVRPPKPQPGDPPPRALFLSLHGAGVEATGQADAYAPKRWGTLVAATNRRPFGFDWEDWGRIDALEVLDLAQRRFGTDPSLTYLTGHSMGGHGTWQVGVTHPDRFAALGPSAGWISFSSYGGRPRATNSSPLLELLNRAANPSDTLLLSSNYLHHGLYILHGDADDNVPVREARTMREHLAPFHSDLAWHEQPGAGHWWENSDEPGAECIDWPPMFDFFARHRIPSRAEIRSLHFATANPGVSANTHYLTIEQQTQPLRRSAVNLRFDPGKRRFVGTTENVARLKLQLAQLAPGAPLTIELDGTRLENLPLPPRPHDLFLERTANGWASASPLSPAAKNPRRNGPFKEAFNHRMIFLYATRGTPEENAWALAKARFDAESFWYRGNGAVEVLPDTAFHPTRHADRNIILYGHADAHAAWTSLLGDSPVQVRRGRLLVGDKTMMRPDLGCLFLRPRPDSSVASVGVVAGTGLQGFRLTDRLPYFLAGVAYPDFVAFGPEVLTAGADGVVAAGFFGNDWSVDRGEFAWTPE